MAAGGSDADCDWLRSGPLEWSAYVNNELRVTTAGKEFGGWLLTVDPVSGSLVLVTLGTTVDEPDAIRVVMGDAVRRVEKLRKADDAAASRLRRLFPAPAPGGSDPRRRDALHRWLESHHVPVEERGDGLRVAGALTVAPPYGPDDCVGDNPVVLHRVRKLLEQYYAQEVAPSHLCSVK
ncbi:gem-associated protein 6 [Corythoichthys intestinalis]|uniref:gem-associated protein 6 n=1 Tax=Corythoichthys intestinalis TaxID=161448 RepID=UPI0025A5A561|nr:gem-associated protein 6 [Corythoichthys intestinalis]